MRRAKTHWTSGQFGDCTKEQRKAVKQTKLTIVSLECITDHLLSGPYYSPMVPRVVEELKAINPAVLIPAHCVGVREAFALAAGYPDAFIPNTVGTSYVFGQTA